MKSLEIPKCIYAKLVEQALREAPQEACGILAGRDSCACVHYEMTNADQSREHFSMVPEEQFEVIREIRARDQEMLAIYHSHPDTPARPSQEDTRLALTPDVVYVILSLQEPERPVIKGFLIENNSATEVPIGIVVA
jgi:[CysO sulfur-carrier protein]-S-L-cysteine hydrolase